MHTQISTSLQTAGPAHPLEAPRKVHLRFGTTRERLWRELHRAHNERMSQTQNPRDNQALLHSMLQRLKLQPGTTTIHSGQNTADEQNIPQEILDLQTINNNPVNGFEPTGNIIKDFSTNVKTQETDSSFDGSGASGHNKEHGPNLQSQSGQLFSPKPDQDTSALSSKEGYNFSTFELKKDTSNGLSTGESTGHNQDQSSAFLPKVYSWSPKSPVTQDNKSSFGVVFEATGENTPTPFNSQNTVNTTKQRSSENKTYRWTQKIKQKWKERPGSFGKKGKDGRFVDKTMQENSPKYLPLTTGNFILPSNEESQGTLTTEETTDHNKTISQKSDGNDEYMRSRNDFDLGLGSFSLLDEIVSGQEWAKFLNPSISASVHEGAPPAMEQAFTNHLSINSMSKDVGSNLWTSGINGEAPNTDIAMNQMSPEPLFPVGMDITEKSGKQSEPMEQGLSQSDMQVTVCEQQPHQPNIKTQQVNTVESSSLRGRNSLSRKRQYQSSERIETMFQSVGSNESDGADDGSVFLPDNHVMNNTDETTMYLFSSTPTPCSPVRGVLKHTISYDSANSSETLSKRRRMEETRRVRFSEEIITIDPPELGPYESDSEEEEEVDDEDSLIEEDSEEQIAEAALFGPGRPEQVAPARRPVLPAWIRALKRRNTGKKPR